MNDAPPNIVHAIAAEKAELRRRMAAIRDAIPSEERLTRAFALVSKRIDPAFHRLLPAPNGVIAAYWPIRSELSPQLLMSHLIGEGFRCALPRVTPEGLVFHEWNRGDDLAIGPFGTSEPQPHWPGVTPDLILAPLLAFDAARNRLGYGRGYYDRAFAAAPSTRRVGLAFREQEVARVPCDAHDLPLEAVFTV